MRSFFASLGIFRTWLEAAPLRRAALVSAAALLAVYAGMPAEELTFDNGFIIGDDTRLRLFIAESLFAIFKFDYWWPSMASNLFRPLTTISFWIEYSFLGYGSSPLGYQLTNLVLQWGNALLLFLLARQLNVTVSGAFLATMVYAVHPITTEVVANIVGRSDLMATAAVLGGMSLYLSALKLPVGRKRTVRLAWTGLCGLVGVMAKESAIVLPCLVAGHGLLRFTEWRAGGELRRTWLRDAWQVALVMLPAAAFFLVTRWIFSADGGVTDHPFIDNPLMAEGLSVTLLSALGVWGMQIGTLFLPLSLSNDYSFNAIPVAVLPFGNATAIWGWATLLVFLFLGYVVWRAFKTRGLAGPWVYLAYLVSMLPTSNLLIRIGSIRAERFHYLPSAFFWVGGVMLISEFRRATTKDPAQKRLGLLGPAILTGAVTWFVCLGVLTHFRCYDWRSNVALWGSGLAAQPESTKINSAAGNARVIANPTEEAELAALKGHLRALEIFKEQGVPLHYWPVQTYSDLLACYINLYDSAKAKGRSGEAIEQWLDSALAVYQEGSRVEATVRARWFERHRDQPAKTAPFLDVFYQNYAVVLSRKGRHEEAIKALDEVIEILPLKARNRTTLAKIYQVAERYRDALDEYLLVRVMEPGQVGDLEQIAQVALKIDATAIPLIRDSGGETKLNLNDKLIEDATRKALFRYRELLEESGLSLDARRVARVGRYFYGVKDLTQPGSPAALSK